MPYPFFQKSAVADSVSIPVGASNTIKNKGPGAFAPGPLFLIQWWRRRESNSYLRIFLILLQCD